MNLLQVGFGGWVGSLAFFEDGLVVGFLLGGIVGSVVVGFVGVGGFGVQGLGV